METYTIVSFILNCLSIIVLFICMVFGGSLDREEMVSLVCSAIIFCTAANYFILM